MAMMKVQESLPAPGLIATLLIGLVAAGWVSRRQD